MALHFDKYVQKGREFINEVAYELDAPDDKDRAARIVRCVLHTFRDRVTPAESLQLIAQLPMLIKAIYVDGWQINNKARRLRRYEDFIAAVKEADGRNALYDFETDYEVEEAIRAVFSVIKNQVSEGEIDDLVSILPSELRMILLEA